MKTLVETSLFNLFASYTNGAGPALGELPAAYDDFVNCLATLSPAGDLTGQLRCLNYTKIELAFMRQACNGMAEDCRNILYDVFIDKTLALLDADVISVTTCGLIRPVGNLFPTTECSVSTLKTKV